MAYDAKGLRVKSGDGAAAVNTDQYREATYITNDAAAVVEAANYFNGAVSRLVKGTVITALMAFSGTPILKRYVVTSNNGVTVVIALQTTTAG